MSNLTEALELIAWFDECDGFRQGTDAPHKWVLQADSELRRLSEQVEKLTKERDKLHRAFNQPVPRSEWEKMQEQLAAKDADNKWLRSAVTLQAEQLAALAEQNEKLREILKRIHNAKEPWSMWDIEQALAFPDLAAIDALGEVK